MSGLYPNDLKNSNKSTVLDLRPTEGKPCRTTLLLDCAKVRSLIQRQNCQPDSSVFVLHEQILAVKSGNFAKPLPGIISGKHWRMLYRAIGNPKLIEIGIKRIEPGRHGIKTPNLYDHPYSRCLSLFH